MEFSASEIVLLALSPFLIHTFVSILSFLTWIYHSFRCGPSLQKRFKLKTNSPCWAIVTGSTSGVGLGFAERLAEAGFNLLLVSRTPEKLENVSKELEEKNGIKTSILPLDLENFPNEEYNPSNFLADVKRLTENEDIRLLVCNAGMSDLARHFTDKPLERNLSIMKLNTSATIAMIQTLLPHLMLDTEGNLKKPKAGIITLGAVTAVYPAPIYAMSSGNKHFVRGFTLAARQEFAGKVDFMIAHPVAVYSNILTEKASYGITPRLFAKNALKDFCKGRAESYGYFVHEVSIMFMLHFMSRWQRGKNFLSGIKHFSKVLDRPIDLNPIEVKLTNNSLV